LTGPAVPAAYFLDGPVVDQAPQDPRDDLLVVPQLRLQGGESDGLRTGAYRNAHLGLPLGELKAVRTPTHCYGAA